MGNEYTLVGVAIGGMLGAVSRFLLSNWVYAYFGRFLPWGTLSVNVLGSFLMGLAVVFFSLKSNMSEPLRQGFMVGYLGALTTYSSFVLDKWNLIEHGELIKALSYFLLTSVACFASFLVGTWLVKHLSF